MTIFSKNDQLTPSYVVEDNKKQIMYLFPENTDFHHRKAFRLPDNRFRFPANPKTPTRPMQGISAKLALAKKTNRITRNIQVQARSNQTPLSGKGFLDLRGF